MEENLSAADIRIFSHPVTKESKIEKTFLPDERIPAPGGKPCRTRPYKAAVFPEPDQKNPRLSFDAGV
jgi:hypothetical protein